MSATHNWSGAVAVNLRSTRSGAGRASRSRTVVVNPFAAAGPVDLALAHQPRDAFVADPNAVVTQICLNARTAVGVVAPASPQLVVALLRHRRKLESRALSSNGACRAQPISPPSLMGVGLISRM
jgi:hypothetical protein